MNSFSLNIQVPQIAHLYFPDVQPILVRQNAYYLLQELTDFMVIDNNNVNNNVNNVYDNRKTLYTWNDVVLTSDELNQAVINASEFTYEST